MMRIECVQMCGIPQRGCIWMCAAGLALSFSCLLFLSVTSCRLLGDGMQEMRVCSVYNVNITSSRRTAPLPTSHSHFMHEPRRRPDENSLWASATRHLAMRHHYLVVVGFDTVVLDLLGLRLHPTHTWNAGALRRIPPPEHSHIVVRGDVSQAHDEAGLRHVGKRVF